MIDGAYQHFDIGGFVRMYFKFGISPPPLHHGVVALLVLRLLALRVVSLDGLCRLLQLGSPVQDKVWLVRCLNNILNPSRGWRRQRALCSERRQYRSSWEIRLRAIVKGAS